MSKRLSEGFLGAAIRAVELPLYVHKPPDIGGNVKPCDFMVWVDLGDGGVPVWFEAKDVDAKDVFNWREMRPGQVAGIREAERVRIPYWIGVYWRRHRMWTLSRGVQLYRATRLNSDGTGGIRSFRRQALSSSFGIDATPGNLSSVVKAILLGELEQ